MSGTLKGLMIKDLMAVGIIDKITKINGMDITFVTTAKTDYEAYLLLKELGLPFKNKTQE